MIVRNKMLTPIKALLIVFLAHAAFAGDGKWIYDPEKGTSPANAALWSDPTNWTNGVVPSAKADRADLREATNRYIRIDTDLELYQLRGCSAGRTVIMGEGKLTLWGTAKNPSVISDYAIYYVPVALKDSLANAWERFENNYMAADFTLLNDGFQNPYNSTWFRSDWYADSSDPVRTNGIVFATRGNYMNLHYTGYHFYGPEGLEEAAASTWRLTAGSPFATPVGEIGHALPPGTLVTAGNSLPEGTFLRRVYPDGTVEFSAAATGDVAGEAEVTFAAFTAQVTYRIVGFGRSVPGWQWTDVNRSREEDDFRVVVEAFQHTGESYPYGFTCESGMKPGTVVIEDGTKNNLWIGVRGGRIEFAGKDALGTDAGVPNGVLAGGASTGDSASAASTSYVVVTNGITARVGRLEYVLGKFVKEGGGTLIAGLPASDYNVRGTFVVKEGTFGFAETDDGAVRAIRTLAISNGATLKVPATGLKITEKLTQEPGAVITGPGMLALPDSADLSAYTVDENVLLVHASQAGFAAADYTWDDIPAATSPLDEGLPVPASWMDASVAASLETQEDAKQLSLLTWKDVRGDGYPVAVHASETVLPEVVTNAAGKPHHVYIARENTTVQSSTRSLKYTPTIPRVKAIFKVYNGCGAFICAQSYTWLRPYPSYGTRIFYNMGSSTPLPGTFYVNGVVRSEKAGSPYEAQKATDKSQFDPQVAEFHFSGSGDSLPTAQRIGYYSGGSDSGRNGLDRICEMILYTNELTFVQRQKICAYLMKKWMHGAEATVDYGAISSRFVESAAGGTVSVGDGQAMVINSVTGAGTFAKLGEGTAYVKDLANADGGLHVSGGMLKLNSTALARDLLPGDPYLHLDASDSNTVEFAAGSSENILRMKDVRGAGHPAAELVTEDKYPTLVAEAQNGLPLVDYGAQVYQGASTANIKGFIFPETDRLYSVFRIAGGAGGGSIAGYIGNPVGYSSGGVLHTVSRTVGGTDSAHAWFGPSTADFALGQGQSALPNLGGTTFRLDGVCTNAASAMHPKDSVQLLVMNGFDHIVSDALGCNYGGQNMTKYWGGNCRDGETILYTNTLSQTSMLKVEAYLNKKWFGKDTPGYRPATTGSLAVDAGATLDIVGGAPVTASSLACEGTVNGAVALAAGASVTLVVNADGSVAPLGVTGGVDFSQGGTVVLTGDVRALTKGEHAVATALGAGFGVWTVTGEGLKGTWEYRLGRSGDTVVLEAIAPGMLLLVR